MLEALTRVLQLDDAERAHLFDLARAANSSIASASARRRPSAQKIRPGVQRILEAMTGAPAWVRNGRMDFLAANRFGQALYAPLIDSPARPANSARFVFLDPRATASSSTGNARRTTSWRSCVPRPAAIPTTGS